MAATRRFSPALVRALDQSKIIGVRAGSLPHRFIGIWVVVVEGRAFVRSWDQKTTGWYHASGVSPRECCRSAIVRFESGRCRGGVNG
jgi:hypothetical protein